MKTAATYEPIESIHPNPNNPRTNAHVIRDVAKSIARFGFSSPIIAAAESRQIIAGHTRYAAARDVLKLKTIPVRFMQLEKNEAAALALADNRLAEKARWNEDKLQNILQTLEAEGTEIADIGFTAAELEHFLQQNNNDFDALHNEDQSTPPNHDLQVNKWHKLGVHRLFVGDCRNIEWGGKNTGLIFDPPWNEEHEAPAAAETLAFCDGRRAGQTIKQFGAPTWIFVWDCMNVHYTHENRPLQRAKHCLFYGDIKQYAQNALLPSKPDKKTTRISKGRADKKMRYQTNPAGTMLADVYTESIAHLHKDNHSHAKPVSWLYTLIANCITSNKVHDPYAGSGASLIAAAKAGKIWEGAEICPQKAQKIIDTWEKYEKRQT